MAAYRFASNIVAESGPDTAENRQIFRRVNMERFERDVMATLDQIWNQSWTGCSIIQHIAKKRGQKVVITPVLPEVCNAFAGEKPDWDGQGEIQIKFNPDTYAGKSACGSGPGATADCVLLHELVHAFRILNGGLKTTSFNAKGFDYDDKEEFFSILLANIHMSAKGIRVLRKDHQGHQPLGAKYATSEGFLKGERWHIRLVREFVCDHWGLCQQHIVKDDTCVFNPIRYFLKHSSELLRILEPKVQDHDPALQRILATQP